MSVVWAHPVRFAGNNRHESGQRTEHLKGIKIGIMGCIVNGPGEMADADYGYVGIGRDKIALYRGQQVIKKSVHADQAVDELIELIREDSRWTEPGLVTD